MDLSYSVEYEAFRRQVREFLAAHWPLAGDEAKLPLDRQAALFRSRAIERGYVARAIPRRYGGSEQEPDALKATILSEEFARAKAPGDIRGIGASMLVPTLLEHGTPAQCERFVPPTVRGEMIWCQGYSEPGSGSDLASLATRAVLDGEHWVVNGHKIWTSGAHFAHYMFCLARTEPDASKHAGISYLLIDMKTPGIEVRPLRQMNGFSAFNEVFLTDVRVPLDGLVGKRGQGWLVSRSTLKHERNMIGDATGTLRLFESLVELAKKAKRNGRPASEDPHVRQQLAELEGYVLAQQYSGYRQLTDSARGASTGIGGLMNKLGSTNVGHRVARLALDLIGSGGLLAPDRRESMMRGEASDFGSWVNQYMWSLGIAIAGGTANIQRNIIAERGLGLPRDAAADRSKPGAQRGEAERSRGEQ
jgi:alkylation response protein AidB-like acyl-CoA dehydrogenase